MNAREHIEEGLLNPLDPRHTCPRCRDVAVTVTSKVYPGLVVRFTCAMGHEWSGSFIDLPADVVAGRMAAR
jgi:hypothetical protein